MASKLNAGRGRGRGKDGLTGASGCRGGTNIVVNVDVGKGALNAGRCRGSGGGRGGLNSVLQAAINPQDNQEIEKSNAYVLACVGGENNYFDEDYEEEEEVENGMEDEDDNEFDLNEMESQSSVRCEPTT